MASGPSVSFNQQSFVPELDESESGFGDSDTETSGTFQVFFKKKESVVMAE